VSRSRGGAHREFHTLVDKKKFLVHPFPVVSRRTSNPNPGGDVSITAQITIDIYNKGSGFVIHIPGEIVRDSGWEWMRVET